MLRAQRLGLEGSRRLAAMARASSGCEVWEQDFLKLDLLDNRFDGVIANATPFHVPSQELPRVLLELHATLKPHSVLFSSNPHGHNEERWTGGCYGAYHDLETGVASCWPQVFLSWLTITALLACHVNSNRGSQASGADS